MAFRILNVPHSSIPPEKREDLFKRFESAASDESRITLMLNFIKETSLFPLTKSESKNTLDSENFKNKANEIFISNRDAKEYLKVWELYSKSIAFAPNNSKELALGFANRSAVLFHFQKYSEAVQDIDRALEANYPLHLKHKLLLRKTECLALLGSSEFDAAYETTLKWINDMSVNTKEALKEKLTATRKVGKAKLEGDYNSVVPSIESKSEIPCASDAVALKHNEKFGRHLVATRKIQPGEILAVEASYSCILNTENMYTHCAYCLKIAWDSIPCENCVFALYCSKTCKDRAWKEYHDIECSVAGHLFEFNLGVYELFAMRLTILALREFASVDKLRAELAEIDSCKDARTKGFSPDGKLRSNKYRSIYSLVRNTEKRTINELIKRAQNSAGVLYFLATNSSFFGESFQVQDFNSLLANEDVMFIGGLILRHYQIIACNIHSIEELRDSNYIESGAGVFPFLSFFNHKCSPNVSRSHSVDSVVLFATHPIEKDEQIFDSYGVIFGNSPRNERQVFLESNYHLKCECIACEQNWPFFRELPSFRTIIKPDSIKLLIEIQIVKLVGYYNSFKKKERLTDNPNVLKDLREIIELLMQYVSPPCLEVEIAAEVIKFFFDGHANRFNVPALKQV